MPNIEQIKAMVHVNIPYSMLNRGYLKAFIDNKLNPEIGLDAATLDSTSAEEYQRVKKAFVEAGLSTTLHGPFIDMSPGSPDPEVWGLTKRRFEQVVEAARIFEPRAVVFHAGYDHKRYGFVHEVWFEQSLKTWQWLSHAFAQEGILLCLENVYEEYPEYLLPLFEELKEKGVRFCFDTGHQAAFSQAPLQRWLVVLGQYMGHLHLHDNAGQSDDHGAIGSGSIEFRLLFDWLAEHFDMPPVITLEPHKEKDLLPSLKWLETNWPW